MESLSALGVGLELAQQPAESEASAARRFARPMGSAFLSPTTTMGDHCSAEMSHRRWKWHDKLSLFNQQPFTHTYTRTKFYTYLHSVWGVWVKSLNILHSSSGGGSRALTEDLGCHPWRRQARFVCFVLSLFGFVVENMSSRYCVWHLCAHGTAECHAFDNYVNTGFQRPFRHLGWVALWRGSWVVDLLCPKNKPRTQMYVYELSAGSVQEVWCKSILNMLLDYSLITSHTALKYG